MRFYFFVTSMQDRGNGPQPTLRPLPNQTFPDGTPVNTNLNVSAPKERGSSRNGSRLDYPDGTVFCSTFLTVVNRGNTTYYSVYDTAAGQGPNKADPDFHPVSDDPAFPWVAPEHRNDRMNIAYSIFKAFGDQEDTRDPIPQNDQPKPQETKPTGTMKKTRHWPADESGRARKPEDALEELYADQASSETALIIKWMKRMLNDSGVRPSAAPKADPDTNALILTLLQAKETLDTIASRTRFDNICLEQRMDPDGLATISAGPLKWYLTELVQEHQAAAKSTACHRNPAHPLEVRDAAYLMTSKLNDEKGVTENFDTPEVLDGMKAAIEAGWTLEHILNPDLLLKYDTPRQVLEAIAGGAEQLPLDSSEQPTLLEKLMAAPENARPDSKDGFYVSERNWRILVRNLHKRKNTLLLGPTGCGKTEIVRRLCEQTGTPFTIIPMGNITDVTDQLVGKMDLDPATKGTKYDWADFALAIQRPGVILLDEINRIPRNGDNALFSVLDGTRCLAAPGAKSGEQRTIRVHPECVFFATANIGTEFTGTKEIDKALSNRFMPLELDYLDPDTEATVLSVRKGIDWKDAHDIALVATNIRQDYKNGILSQAVSTRETLECAECVKDGFDVKDSMEICFLPLFEGGTTENDTSCERNAVRAKIASRLNTGE